MRLIFATMVLCLGVAGAAAAGPSWTGSWRLDREASRLRGELTVIGGGPGGYRFDFGATQFVIQDDGQFHPTVASRETSLAALSDREWRRVHRIRDTVADESLLTLSEDRRTLTVVTSAPGRPATTETLQREGAGAGLAGAWRSTRLGVNVAESLTFKTLQDGRLQWGAPEDGNFYVVKPDGQAAANEGPTAVPGVTLAVRSNGSRRFDWIEAIGGKPYVVGSDDLSPDGQILTETTHPAARPSEAQVAVYRRQSTP